MSSIVSIRLQSNDGEIFNVDAQTITKVSGTIKNMLDDGDIVEDGIIQLPNIKASILLKVLQWANYHKNDPEPDNDDDNDNPNEIDKIIQWDVDFLNVDQETLFKLIEAATYLDTKGLKKLACMTIAKMVRGKTVKEIRKVFNIKNEWSDEEDEQDLQEDRSVEGK